MTQGDCQVQRSALVKKKHSLQREARKKLGGAGELQGLAHWGQQSPLGRDSASPHVLIFIDYNTILQSVYISIKGQSTLSTNFARPTPTSIAPTPAQVRSDVDVLK